MDLWFLTKSLLYLNLVTFCDQKKPLDKIWPSLGNFGIFSVSFFFSVSFRQGVFSPFLWVSTNSVFFFDFDWPPEKNLTNANARDRLFPNIDLFHNFGNPNPVRGWEWSAKTSGAEPIETKDERCMFFYIEGTENNVSCRGSSFLWPLNFMVARGFLFKINREICMLYDIPQK